MTSYGLWEVLLHSGGEYDVTQAAWWPPCRVRRVIKKAITFYKKLYKNSNMSGTILYGLSMSSSMTLSIHLLCIFLSFKVIH